jgi:hypothetical protein
MPPYISDSKLSVAIIFAALALEYRCAVNLYEDIARIYAVNTIALDSALMPPRLKPPYLNLAYAIHDAPNKT